MDRENRVDEVSIGPGTPVHDSDGQLLGHVTNLTNDGFEVKFADSEENTGEELPGQEFGEGYLMWRCTECGEMGELEDGIPDSCPSCGAPREALINAQED
jgi:rubrerythrin